MKSLNNIIQTLPCKMISNEKYYKLSDLLKKLNAEEGDIVEVEELILTPYYISDGRRLELYEYELDIFAECGRSVEDYLLTLTGKQSVQDIPSNIVQMRTQCYMLFDQKTSRIEVSRLVGYLHFVLTNRDIQNQANSCFGSFDADNLYLEID